MIEPVARPTGASTASIQTGSAVVGVVAMAVMGRNLARHGHTIALYNRTTERTEEVVAAHSEEGVFVPRARTRPAS